MVDIKEKAIRETSWLKCMKSRDYSLGNNGNFITRANFENKIGPTLEDSQEVFFDQDKVLKLGFICLFIPGN